MAAGKKSMTGSASYDFVGFNVLPVHVNKDTMHCIYMKRHESRSESDPFPSDRTLFLCNLPMDTTITHVRHIFEECGKITHVIFGGDTIPPATEFIQSNKKRKANKQPMAQVATTLRKIYPANSSAHVVFSSSQEFEKALVIPRRDLVWKADKTEQPLGFRRYVLACQLSRPDPQDLQAKVDSYMLKFKQNEYQREQEELKKINEIDEDGFTTVTRRKGFNAGTPYMRRPKKQAIEFDFYKFQLKERKRKELLDMRKRFEEDKQKIAKLKEARKFKPF